MVLSNDSAITTQGKYPIPLVTGWNAGQRSLMGREITVKLVALSKSSKSSPREDGVDERKALT